MSAKITSLISSEDKWRLSKWSRSRVSVWSLKSFGGGVGGSALMEMWLRLTLVEERVRDGSVLVWRVLWWRGTGTNTWVEEGL